MASERSEMVAKVRSAILELNSLQESADVAQIENFLEDTSFTFRLIGAVERSGNGISEDALVTQSAQMVLRVLQFRKGPMFGPNQMSEEEARKLRSPGYLYVGGKDLKGRPMIYARTWLIPDNDDVEKNIWALTWTIEEARKQVLESDVGLVMLVDMKHLALSMVVLQKALEVLIDYYPGVFDRVYLWKMPQHASSLHHCLNNNLDPTLMSLVECFQGSEEDEVTLAKALGAKCLEKEFGGDLTTFSDKQGTYELEKRHLMTEMNTEVAWRTPGTYYRCNQLHFSIVEIINGGLAGSDGAILAIDSSCRIECLGHLTGIPKLRAYFQGSEMMRTADFHPCVISHDLGAEQQDHIVTFVPPDTIFDLAQFPIELSREGRNDGSMTNGSGTANLETVPKPVRERVPQIQADSSVGPDTNIILDRFRLPLKVIAMAEENDKRTQCTHKVVVSLTNGMKSAENIRLRVPLHPEAQAGTARLSTSGGDCRLEESQVVWDILKIDADSQCELNVDVVISQTILSRKPDATERQAQNCELAMQNEETKTLFSKLLEMEATVEGLNQEKHPFLRDRTASQKERRMQLNILIRKTEGRIISRFLSQAIEPIMVSVETVSGSSFSSLHCTGCVLLNDDFPWSHGSDCQLSVSGFFYRYADSAALQTSPKPKV